MVNRFFSAERSGTAGRGRILAVLVLAAALVLSMAATAFADDAGDTLELVTAGLTLPIPAEYSGLLIVEVPQGSDRGELFSVSEKASVEAAKAQGYEWDGAGWLFSIGKVTEETLHQMLCRDMSGAIPFAADGQGTCYIFYHPTDVRLVRESYEGIDADLEQWSALNEWGSDVRKSFPAVNGLTPLHLGNTDLDIFLARTLYQDDVDYTVSTTQYGPLEPKGVDPEPYAGRLTRDVTYQFTGLDEAPDGEYVVLAFPDENIRFDFFLMEGKENFVREVHADGFETIYQAVFDDGVTTAAGVMQEWYDALAAAAGVQG